MYKRLLSIVAALAIVMISVPSVWAETTDWETKTKDADLRFAFLTDTHVYMNNEIAVDRFKGALSAYQKVDGIDFLAFGGDIILQTANAVGTTAIEIPTGY